MMVNKATRTDLSIFSKQEYLYKLLENAFHGSNWRFKQALKSKIANHPNRTTMYTIL